MTKRKLRFTLYSWLAITTLVIFYLFTPAINLHSQQFRFLILLVTLLAVAIEIAIDKQAFLHKKIKYAVLLIPAVAVLAIALGNVFNGVIFRSTDYAGLIQVEEKNFEQDFPVMDEASIPMMDRDTAQRLGDRRIGSVNELVSQFVPAETYTQINSDNEPYRVTPLHYASFIRWISNQDEGIPNYLKVDMVLGEVEVVDLAENIKFSDSELLNRNVKRHLRFKYPTNIFENPSFEVDEEGLPHYIATTYENEFWFTQLEPRTERPERLKRQRHEC